MYHTHDFSMYGLIWCLTVLIPNTHDAVSLYGPIWCLMVDLIPHTNVSIYELIWCLTVLILTHATDVWTLRQLTSSPPIFCHPAALSMRKEK